MGEQPVVIISTDRDFGDALAEHVRGELKLPCIVAAHQSEVKQQLDSALAAVATEAAEETLPCPLILVKHRPVKLQHVLEDIARLARNPQADIALGGDYTLQPRQKTLLHASGQSVALTDKEAKLLMALAEAKGQVVPKEQLLKDVWGMGEALDTHTLETHIYRLRGKFRELDETNEMIAAVEGGYMLAN